MAGPFDLERFAPNPYFEFVLHNVTYRCHADPDVDQVARMLRLEQTIQDGRGEDLAAAMIEGKQLLVELIRDVDPDADLAAFKIGGTALLATFAALLYGESVAQAVLQGIAAETPDAPPEPASDDPEGLQPDDPEAFAATEGGDVAPLALAKPSPEPSSASDELDATRLGTGTG